MFGSQIIDIAIGMAFIYLLVSLVCSAVAELIEQFFKYRARKLEKGIQEMLDPNKASAVVECLYNHGLVNSLYKGSYGIAKKTELPSYIPARNFALALLDLMNNPPVGLVLPHNVTQAIRTLTISGQDLQQNVEAWYNSAMDRVSGWYKRRSQTIILTCGLVIATALNIDSVYVARTLSNDATLRQSLVAAAQEYAKQPGSNPNLTTEQKIKTNISTIEGLGLPVGWFNEGNDPARQWPGIPHDRSTLGTFGGDWLHLLYLHWMGWFLTAFAVSFGAPFWFDLLNKFMVVRATVKPHEKSQEDKSKDD